MRTCQAKASMDGLDYGAKRLICQKGKGKKKRNLAVSTTMLRSVVRVSGKRKWHRSLTLYMLASFSFLLLELEMVRPKATGGLPLMRNMNGHDGWRGMDSTRGKSRKAGERMCFEKRGRANDGEKKNQQ